MTARNFKSKNVIYKHLSTEIPMTANFLKTQKASGSKLVMGSPMPYSPVCYHFSGGLHFAQAVYPAARASARLIS